MVLIDTWWNVNVYTRSLVLYLGLVLIDTWWNVNAPTTGTAKKTARVLIDTWWNVNFIRKSSNYKNGNGFNRYMVECE